MGMQFGKNPNIYSLEDWVRMLWKDLYSAKVEPPTRLLTTIEQQLIWERIILSSKEGEELFEIASTVNKAIDAWNMLLQYDLSIDLIDNYKEQYIDAKIFQCWAKQYKTISSQEGWIDFLLYVKSIN